MFTRVQVQRFRSLRSVDQDLGRFQALVGPNASGKSTFLDVLAFLGDLMRLRGDVPEAVMKRSANMSDLTWKGEGPTFALAVEAMIPDSVRAVAGPIGLDSSRVRYEIEVGLDRETNEIGLDHEALWISGEMPEPRRPERELFPEVRGGNGSVFLRPARTRRLAVKKRPDGMDEFYPEVQILPIATSYRLGRMRSTLASLPADEGSFPIALWFRGLLEGGVQSFILNSRKIKQPSPPGLGKGFQMDGSNLPWVIHELRKDRKQFFRWKEHVRTSLADVRDIRTVEREEDRHRYLVIEYQNGASVPSWLVSDGTLRLLALTIPAYLRGMDGTFLIEEPENGVHPRALETVIQSLSSIYDGQVLIATHSPVVVSLLEPRQLLCFAKDAEGATDIIAGDRHPRLREWVRGMPDLGVLLASGILS